MIEPYQFFDDVVAEEDEALVRSILAHGVEVEIEADEAGRIIKGHRRVRAYEQAVSRAREQGLTPPEPPRTRIVPGLSEAEKNRRAFENNINRRHMDPYRLGRALRRYLNRKGVRRGRGRQRAKTATLADIAAEVGLALRTAEWVLHVADVLDARPLLGEQVLAGKLSTAEAMRLAGGDRREPARDRRIRRSPDDLAYLVVRLDDLRRADPDAVAARIVEDDLATLGLPDRPRSRADLADQLQEYAGAVEDSGHYLTRLGAAIRSAGERVAPRAG